MEFGFLGQYAYVDLLPFSPLTNLAWRSFLKLFFGCSFWLIWLRKICGVRDFSSLNIILLWLHVWIGLIFTDSLVWYLIKYLMLILKYVRGFACLFTGCLYQKKLFVFFYFYIVTCFSFVTFSVWSMNSCHSFFLWGVGCHLIFACLSQLVSMSVSFPCSILGSDCYLELYLVLL